MWQFCPCRKATASARCVAAAMAAQLLRRAACSAPALALVGERHRGARCDATTDRQTSASSYVDTTGHSVLTVL